MTREITGEDACKQAGVEVAATEHDANAAANEAGRFAKDGCEAGGARAYDWNGRHFKTLFRRTPQTKNVSHWMFAPEPNDL